MPLSPKHLSSTRRQPRWTRPVALVTAGALAVSALLISSATAADTDASEARAALIEADLLSVDLADLITVESGTPSDPTERTADIDVALLQQAIALNVEALELPLIAGSGGGLLHLGDGATAGLLKGYAYAPDASTATAASGALTDSGAIDVTAGENHPTGVARVDLTGLTDQLGVAGLTDELIDRLSLELGALASTAHAETGSTPTSDYLVAGAVLTVHSPAVARLGADLREAVDAIEAQVNSTFGPTGALHTALQALALPNVDLIFAQASLGAPQVSLSVELSNLFDELLGSPLVASNGVVVDLVDGTISVDLAKLAGGLNDLPANTELLTSAQISSIVESVAGVLDDAVTETVSSALDAVGASQLTVSYSPTVTGPGVTSTLGVTITGTLANFAGQGSPQVTTTGSIRFLNSPLPVTGLLGQVTRLILPAITPVATGVLSPDAELFRPLAGAVGDLLESLDPVLAPVLEDVLSVTINAQSTASNGAFTVRALQVTLLPETDALVLPLASSTVRVSPAVITGIGPDHGPETGGTAITITGVGFTGATGVTVDGNPATNVVVVNDTTVTAVTPPGVVGPREVIVMVPAGSSTPGGFTYEPVVRPSPSASGSPTTSETPTASVSPTPSETPTASGSPSGSASPSGEPTQSTRPTAGPSATATPVPGVRPGVPSTGADGAAPVAAVALLAAAVGLALRLSRRNH